MISELIHLSVGIIIQWAAFIAAVLSFVAIIYGVGDWWRHLLMASLMLGVIAVIRPNVPPPQLGNIEDEA